MTSTLEAPADRRPARPAERDLVAQRGVTAHVSGGLDGTLRVVAMLRGRMYRVHDLTVEVRDGVVESRISATVSLTSAQADLLLERLRRMPAVVSADHG
ncbi:hypothetical protein [Pseudonocardia sp. N23]|uniref:hypothetical protein n=1 Tax=Pseudonocardia sp. N23 TaxID=1987376 RepID=UPI000BFC3561|nr:hypothetical protein [Pseudonocardia sp. N23]GAY09755.1 hypothetical protein TOK_4108 [Pseudonocardia sp. N23]